MTSRVKTIRQAISSALLAVDGINHVDLYPPSTINTNGTAWIGFFETVVVPGMSHREEHHHEVPIVVVANRNATLEQATEATENLIEAVELHFRAPYKLGLAGLIGFKYTSVEQGFWDVNELRYVGFQMTLSIIDRRLVSYSP